MGDKKGLVFCLLILIVIVCVACVMKYESEIRMTGNYITPNENCPESQIIIKISNVSNASSSLWYQKGNVSVCYTDFFGTSYNAPDYNKQISSEELNDYSIQLVGGSSGNYFSPKTVTLNKSDIIDGGCNIDSIREYKDNEWVTAIDPLFSGENYWIRVTSDCIINYSGSQRDTSLSIDFYPGWNNFGFGIDNISFDEVRFNKNGGCKGIKFPIWEGEVDSSSSQVKDNLFNIRKKYDVYCGSEEIDTDSYPFGQIYTGHYCSGQNSILAISTKGTASLKIDNEHTKPVCFGNLICTNVSSKSKCDALGGKVILGLSAETNANLSLENRDNFSVSLCCNNNALVCTSNFTAINTSCRAGDTREVWYNDSNNCGSTLNIPANVSYKCDYDNNGFIGNLSSLIQTRTNLGIYIDSSLGNLSKVYNLTKKIEFKESNSTIIEFNYNFSLSGPLDFSKIEITKQPNSSSYGYLVIKGIEFNKTIKIDKLNDESDSVCIRNSQSAQLSSFSNNCDSSSEVLLECPGNYSQYRCTVSNNQFVISGLTSSAVKEMIFTEDEEECESDWECEEWGECDDETKARICIDLNECENDRVEESSCSVGNTQCIPDWKCQEWGPVECPETGKQTRVCTDIKNCNTLINKPSESKSCKYGFSGFIFWILLIILISLILIAILLIVYSYQKRLNP